MPRDITAADADWQAQLADWVKERPRTRSSKARARRSLAYGLTDSPVGSRRGSPRSFHAWTDNDGTIESAIARDDMLANISLYWFTGAIGSSFWTYYARTHGPWPVPFPITVPTAYAAFPKEILRPPRAVAEKYYTNIQRWTAMEKGGHFGRSGTAPSPCPGYMTSSPFIPNLIRGQCELCANRIRTLTPNFGLVLAAAA